MMEMPSWQITGSKGSMQLSPDLPIGRPSFDLSEDQIATVVDLLCSGVAAARPLLQPGMLEVPITIHVRKAMRRLKKELGLSNLEIMGEFERMNSQATAALSLASCGMTG